MKVLSIQEPFATLICSGQKHIETRSWKTNYRGEIYIHASRKKFKEKIITNFNEDELNYGYIICKCRLVDCIYMDEAFIKKISENKTEFDIGIYSIGRYAWILEDISPLEVKIKAKGKLGIWNYNLK